MAQPAGGEQGLQLHGNTVWLPLLAQLPHLTHVLAWRVKTDAVRLPLAPFRGPLPPGPA